MSGKIADEASFPNAGSMMFTVLEHVPASGEVHGFIQFVPIAYPVVGAPMGETPLVDLAS